jgi:hypothetical protein
MRVIDLGGKKALYVGPTPDDPRPGMALRGWVNEHLKIQGNVVKGTCPLCGGKAKGKLRRGKVTVIEWRHREWCPVPTDGILLRR